MCVCRAGEIDKVIRRVVLSAFLMPAASRPPAVCMYIWGCSLVSAALS